MTVTEIYASIQGESTWVGVPMVFIRLTYCNLRCRWCDTTYAFENGDEMTIDAIIEKVESYGLPQVEITGGEPLVQKETPELARRLLARNYHVLLETGGSKDISVMPPEVVRIVDFKCPGSGEEAKNDWNNVQRLQPHDQIKFVLVDRADYDWACAKTRDHDLAAKNVVLFSPVHGELDPQKLIGWIIEDRLPVRFQAQVHKYIWPPDTKGV